MGNSPTALAFLALFGWVPLVFLVFAMLPSRRAMVVCAISGWLLLPSLAVDLPGLPEFNKATAVSAGILLSTLVFEPRRLFAFRPRWFDLPICLWCLCPLLSSIQNNLGIYDGVAGIVEHIIAWLLPYFIGRIYLTDADGFRELALGMVIGGMCLVLPCLFEARMSAQLQSWIYGVGKWEGTRLGGYRPKVFFRTGLELGLWMNAVTLVSGWLWRTGQLQKLWIFPGGLIFSTLLMTALLCRSTGATLLFLAGVCSLGICWRTKTKWAMWGLLLVAPLHYTIRIPDLWSGQQAVALIRTLLGKERADSLQYRLENEDLLIAKALQRPILGWGGWARQFVYNEWNGQISVPDGLWVVAFGENGFVGLVTMTLGMLLPAVLFLRRFPVERWGNPDLAPVTVIATIVSLYMLDSLINAMLNVIYIIAAGGLVNITPALFSMRLARRGAIDHLPMTTSDNQPVLPFPSPISGGHLEEPVTEATVFDTHREVLGARYQSLGRALKNQGDFVKAKAAWFHALDLFSELKTTWPGVPTLVQKWCDCANDLAWLLVSAPDSAIWEPTRAIALASEAVETYPECGTYWNTLGAAYYRAGDFNGAITAINRATQLTGGGATLDHLFLAMAHAQLNNQEQARHWLAQATVAMKEGQTGNTELLRIYDEAMVLLYPVAETSAAPG
jgi:tetratricopeptide (TPR) repeat protein